MSTAATLCAGWTDEPPRDCGRCERLAQFRADNAKRYPDYFNAPVPSFGSADARLLIVGLAPGLHGANRTGRPFTGDYAGYLLYSTLKAQGLARGEYEARADDGFTLVDCAITNAVRCVPPENKPTPAEIKTCRDFLTKQLVQMPNLKAVLTLGQISHNSVLSALAIPKKSHPFAHGATHHAGKITLIASYHCSRYNTNTGVLTTEMFEKAVATAKKAAGI
ncbi:MAG TPA: uracil-DNA glycosylase [Rhizomicrobium sp.]|nr:uracil-DNA glycosylase [Rhizomicrobium sp.]